MKHTNMTNNPHEITLQEAITMTHAYQNTPQFAGQTKAGLITASAVQDLLNQPGCLGVRIYFALNTNNDLTTVMVGTNSTGEDMTDGILLNKNQNCPPWCSPSSELQIDA
jgi:hypothetical protein